MTVVNPLTGELVDDTLEELVEKERAVDRYLRSLSPHYEFRRRLRGRIAELRGPAELPARRVRSDVQQRVSECPRCSLR